LGALKTDQKHRYSQMGFDT